MYIILIAINQMFIFKKYLIVSVMQIYSIIYFYVIIINYIIIKLYIKFRINRLIVIYLNVYNID